jgi:hypothetical protein
MYVYIYICIELILELNQQWYILIMKYVEYSSILSNVCFKVYMFHLLRFSFLCKFLTVYVHIFG